MKPHHDIHSSMRSYSGRRAFSLIEVMVAVSLLSFIIVGLLAMFFQVQRAFRAGTAQADIMEGGRATMGLIVRDLQEMTACNFEFVTNCVVVPSVGAADRLQDIPTGSQRTNFFQDIALLSRFNDGWIGTTYRVSNAVNGVGVLYRFVTNRSRETLPVDNFIAISNVSESVSFVTGLGDSRFARVLDGVVGLTITALDTNGQVYFNNDPSLAPGPTEARGYTIVNRHIVQPDFYGFRSDALPAYLDIELSILEPSTLAKFRGREDISQAQALEYLQRQIGRTHVFRQRVAIRPSATQVSSVY